MKEQKGRGGEGQEKEREGGYPDPMDIDPVEPDIVEPLVWGMRRLVVDVLKVGLTCQTAGILVRPRPFLRAGEGEEGVRD